MFQWMQKRRAERAERMAHAEMIEQDEYLRKLRNSSAGLCGLSFQGHGASEVLSIWEIRALLRMELDRLAARGEKVVQGG